MYEYSGKLDDPLRYSANQFLKKHLIKAVKTQLGETKAEIEEDGLPAFCKKNEAPKVSRPFFSICKSALVSFFLVFPFFQLYNPYFLYLHFRKVISGGTPRPHLKPLIPRTTASKMRKRRMKNRVMKTTPG